MNTKTATESKTHKTTPMMAQYVSIKAEHTDCLLFYRMGDFYELFFDDAVTASNVLSITLTKRGQHMGKDISMCGVPFHACENYIARLIKAGHKVAICEQTETPQEAKKRGYKSVVNREVIRIITPGTLTEENLLPPIKNNFIASFVEQAGNLAIAWMDVSTGEFNVTTTIQEKYNSTLHQIHPAEVITNETMSFPLDPTLNTTMTHQSNARFHYDNNYQQLLKAYKLTTLDGFGHFTRVEIIAAGSLLDYICLTQKGSLPNLQPLGKIHDGHILEIDAATRKNLEVNTTLSGERYGSLLHTIDKTQTRGGARTLSQFLNAPLTDIEKINKRLKLILFFNVNLNIVNSITSVLKSFPDIERSLSRLSLNRGGPRDLAAIRDGTDIARNIKTLIGNNDDHPILLKDITTMMQDFDKLSQLLSEALEEELPLLTRDGNFIRPQFDPFLDEQRALKNDGKSAIIALQAQYAEQTSIDNLKIKHNNVLGYFIEVTAKNSDALMEDSTFIHRQTLANNMRFTTVKLNELEGHIIDAADKFQARETELFQELCAKVLILHSDIITSAKAISMLDVFVGLSTLAKERQWVKPTINNSRDFSIDGGRHPVIENILPTGGFIPNDCGLGDDTSLWLLTGPNMAGKSTFLRQNALIIILAQMGSFVPAAQARIGVVDKLFSRVGAADDLARGLSTFMVEMVETANILNQASDRSFVILDEIGRGTATFDGLSIAWACVEYLIHHNKCRALFATHYHEITTIEESEKQVACYTMVIKEWNNDIIFQHQVVKGTADKSYGIQVAQKAGVPKQVIHRANEVMALFSSQQQGGNTDDLPLFTNSVASVEPTISPLEEAFKEIDLDTLTPKQALDTLYELKNTAK